MSNSTCYYRNCKLEEYHTRLRAIEGSMFCYRCGDRIPVKVCAFNETDANDAKRDALAHLVDDYQGRKCRFAQNTLFDMCVRDNIGSFKAVFANPGTKNTLNALYAYLNTLPKRLRVKNKTLTELDDNDSYYIKYYINLFLPYDLVTVLLENYTDSTVLENLVFLEIIIEDVMKLLEKNFNSV